MSGPQLWVWIGADDDKLDVLRYVTATKKDILNQPIVRDAIAAKVARLRAALAAFIIRECAALPDASGWNAGGAWRIEGAITRDAIKALDPAALVRKWRAGEGR